MIDLGGEAIGAGEYTHLGRITEFKYCNHIAEAFRKHYPISNLKTLGEDWGKKLAEFAKTAKIVLFIHFPMKFRVLSRHTYVSLLLIAIPVWSLNLHFHRT